MKRHRLDLASLIFGAIFLAIVAWWLLARSVDLALPTFGWFIALGLIAIGVVGLVGVVRGGHRPAGPSPVSSWDRPAGTAGDDDPTTRLPGDPFGGAGTARDRDG